MSPRDILSRSLIGCQNALEGNLRSSQESVRLGFACHSEESATLIGANAFFNRRPLPSTA